MVGKKVLLLVHRDLVPPLRRVPRTQVRKASWRTEYDVLKALIGLGHTIEVVGLDQELGPLRARLWSFKPDVVFNLLEEFRGEAVFESNIIAYLEMIGVPFTGCGSKGLMLARDKMLAKKLASYHGVRTPRGRVYPRPRPSDRSRSPFSSPSNLAYPLIVKSRSEEASMGIDSKSIVRSARALAVAVRRVWSENLDDALVEEFIDGREIYASILVHRGRVQVLPIREMIFGHLTKGVARIATERIKWDEDYRKKRGIYTKHLRGAQTAAWFKSMHSQIHEIVEALNLDGYARLDFRLRCSDGELFFIEANPNPQIAREEDFADSARAAGWSYEDLIQHLLDSAQAR